MDETDLDYRDPEWVAERLGLDKNTVYKYLQDGVIPGLRLGHRWLISESALAEWLAAEMQKQTRARQEAADSTGSAIGRLRDFSPQCRELIRRAHAEARARGHTEYGQGHLLLAMFLDDAAPAVRLLQQQGLSEAKFRKEFERRCPAAAGDPPRRLPRTEAAKLAMHLAAANLDDRPGKLVPVADLLWGIAAAGDGVGYDILRAFKVDCSALMQTIEEADSAEEGD